MAEKIETKTELKQEEQKKKRRKSTLLSSRSNVIGLAVFGSIIISALMYFFVITPQLEKVQTGGEYDISLIQKELEEKKLLNQDLQTLISNFDNIDNAEVKLVSMILPNKKAIPELFSQLEVIAKQSGVQIVSLAVAEKEDTSRPRSAVARAAEPDTASKLPEDIKQLTIQFDVRAINYSIYKNFIDAIQSNSRILDIERLNYSPDQETQGLVLRTYYLDSE